MQKDEESFYITTLGCKLNYAESSSIADNLCTSGLINTKDISCANWIIVNSCAVTAVAEKKTRQLLSKLLKNNSKAKVIITGCMADVNEKALAEILENRKSFIAKNFEKKDIINIILKKKIDYNCKESFCSAYNLEGRTRSFLKIQNGCDNFCTYCTVPYSRGRSNSNTIEKVLLDIEKIIEKGFKEIILTGVNIADFGKHNEESFHKLIKEIDYNFSGLRVRMGSTEPDLLNDKTIELIAKSNVIMPHFHLPLQSGCDSTLKRMGRHYNSELYAQKVNTIKNVIPNACLACDVIAGFPAETDEEFNISYSFIKSIAIDFLHVFPYSNRPLARASMFDNQIKPHTIRKRMSNLLTLGKIKQVNFFNNNLNLEKEILIESTNKNNLCFGFTDNYIKCAVNFAYLKVNSIINVKLNSISADNNYVLASVL